MYDAPILILESRPFSVFGSAPIAVGHSRHVGRSDRAEAPRDRHLFQLSFPPTGAAGERVMLGCLIVLATIVCGQQPDASLIIQRHEDSLSRLYSIRAKYELRRSTDGGKTWKPASRISLLRGGRKDRFHETIYGGYYASRWLDNVGHRDLAYSPADFRIMTGIDPDHPPRLPLTGQEQPRVNAAIYPPEPIGPHGRKNSLASVLLLIPAPNYSLRELYNASRSKVIKKLRGASGGDRWTFSLQTPDNARSYLISISPEHNYCISEVTVKTKGDLSAGARSQSRTSEVIEFDDFDLGLSLPKTGRVSNETDKTELFEWRLTVESLNSPIPDSELVLEFPPGTRVNDGVGMAFHVWGDGRPDLSFRTGKEMNNWILEQDRRAAVTGFHRRRTPWTSVLLFSALSLALIVLIFTRWRIMKHSGLAKA